MLRVAVRAAEAEACQSPHVGGAQGQRCPCKPTRERRLLSLQQKKSRCRSAQGGWARALTGGSSGCAPPVPITAPVLASKGPRGQPNSGADSHLPPHRLYSWEGRERVLGPPASRPSGPDRAWRREAAGSGLRCSGGLWYRLPGPSFPRLRDANDSGVGWSPRGCRPSTTNTTRDSSQEQCS